jgi:hypothetical protein
MRATFRLLCAALLCGTVTTLQAESKTDSLGSDEKKNPFELRTWTDTTGARTAQARLLEVRDGKARLRKSNGKFAVIVITELSDRDQAFLAALPSSAFRAARRPSERPPVEDGLLTNGKLPGVGGLLNRFQAVRPQAGSADNAEAPTFPLLAPAPDIMPARLVHIRVSRRLLEQNIEKVVVRQHPVVDNILGTSLRGNARTSATTTLSLLDNPNQAVFDVVFSGVVKSQTRGVNGPVVLHGSATTPFYAAKRLVLNANGMSMSPTVTQARTSSVTHDIDSTLPRLRGRIAERVAWRRSSEMRSEADAIASQHAAARIRTEFDKEVQQNIARIERILVEGTRDLPLEFENGAPSIHFSSTPKHLDIVMHRPEATPEEIAQVPPAVDGDPLLAIRAHRVAVRQALTKTALKQMVQNLLGGLRADSKLKTVKTAAPEVVAFEIKWSPDRNWLIFDHFDQPGQPRKPKPIQLPVAQAAVSEKPAAP